VLLKAPFTPAAGPGSGKHWGQTVIYVGFKPVTKTNYLAITRAVLGPLFGKTVFEKVFNLLL
jgi:hypothetical protein